MTKKLVLFFLLILGFVFSTHGQNVCSEFTITGTSVTPYYPSQDAVCAATPTPAGQILWTGYGDPNGFIKHTFISAQTDVSIWYTIINRDDYGTINVNGGGVLSLSIVSGCGNASGNILGPYTGVGAYGDILVNIKSSLPFTEVTLFNTGVSSGQCTGDCNSVIINSNPCQPNLGSDRNLCLGETLLLDATTANATYLWQDNSTNATFNVTQSGIYSVTVTTNSCSKSDAINVNFNPIPIINLGSDTILCLGETLLLDATTANAIYLWQDNSTNPIFNVTQPGTYWSEITVNKCRKRDSILIDKKYCEVIIQIPNLFTPNNDGHNDLFSPILSKGIIFMNTIIYNKWGSKVFENNNLLIEWDGDGISDGVYYWVISYTDANSVENKLNGYVMVLR